MKNQILPIRTHASSKSLIKRLQTLVLALGLATCGAGIANANDLSNPDLDLLTGAPDTSGVVPVGWTVNSSRTISGDGFNDGEVSEPWCNYQQLGGYGLFFKPFGGSTNVITDLLNVYVYQDNPSAPGAKCTLSGYAVAEDNFCAFIMPPPPGAPQAQALFVVEFLDNGNNVISSNALDLVTAGLSTAGHPVPSTQFTTPQYTAPAGTVTVRAGVFMINAYGTKNPQSFFADSFDLETIAPAGLPVITNQPSATTALLGGTATFTVGVSNALGATYQWQFEGNDLVNGSGVSGVIAGATSKTLTITGATTNSVGHYRVKVTGTATVVSQPALLALDTFNFYPVVALYGVVGATYQVSYSTAVNGTYTPLSTNTLTMSPQYIIDSTSAGNNTRFYQTTFLH